MELLTEKNLDYLTARLHGRRSRLADGVRLESLTHLKSVTDLGRELYPGARLQTAIAAQRRIIQGLIHELTRIRHHLSGPEGRLMDWILLRFDLENLKLALRAIHSQLPEGELAGYLITPSGKSAPDWVAITGEVGSPEAFANLLPAEPWGHKLREALDVCRDHQEPFLIEAALDQGYFRDGLILAAALPAGDRALVKALIAHEADIFHMMLAIRGRFHYGLPANLLAPFHVAGTPLTHGLFSAMLAAPDIASSVRLVSRLILEAPVTTDDPGALERLAWKRQLTLANRAFRRSVTHFGTIAGYAGLRRLEAANLITLSEGLRLRITEDTLRRLMIPPLYPEASRV